MFRKIFLFSFLSFLILFSVRPRQILLALELAEDDLIVKSIPATHFPNVQINISINSYVFDINRSLVSWYLDGKLQSSDVGEKTFSFQIGPAGSLTTLDIIIKTSDGQTIKRTLLYRPASVDLVFEATDSYVPPFYEGKALVSHLGGMKVVAFPNFITEKEEKLDPGDMIYTWKVNGKVQGSLSGYAKNVFFLDGPDYHKGVDVFVSVESADGKYKSARLINLQVATPKIVFYEKSPTLGLLLNRALGDRDFNLVEEEVLIEAVPYFMSDLDDPSVTMYRWTSNGRTIPTFGNRNQISNRQQSGSSGYANLNLKINNLTKILQFAENGFRINFGSLAKERLSYDDFDSIRSGYYSEDSELSKYFGGGWE